MKRQKEASSDTDKCSLVFCGSGFFGVKPGEGASAPALDGSASIDDGSIYTFQLDENGAACTLAPHGSVVKQSGTFPLWIAVDESRRFLYATGCADTSQPGYVYAYAVDEDGSLHSLGSQSSQGAVPCHVAVVGKTLLVANFVGGNIAALPIKDDGSLGVASSVHAHGPGFAKMSQGLAHPRQASAHPHMVAADPQAKFVLVPDMGTNSVIVYKLDAESSKLTKHDELVLHEGCGPRHLAFSPVAPFVYVIGELDNIVVPLRYDAAAGKLSPLEIVDGGRVNALLPGTPCKNGGGAAEVVVSPDGRHAYASVRCTGAFNVSEPAAFNCIAVLSLDTASGVCNLIHSVHSGGNFPWAMAFNTVGNLLTVSNQHTRHSGLSEKEGGDNDGHNGEGPGLIVVFKRDLETGMLMHSGVSVEVPQAVCVTVVPGWAQSK